MLHKTARSFAVYQRISELIQKYDDSVQEFRCFFFSSKLNKLRLCYSHQPKEYQRHLNRSSNILRKSYSTQSMTNVLLFLCKVHGKVQGRSNVCPSTLIRDNITFIEQSNQGGSLVSLATSSLIISIMIIAVEATIENHKPVTPTPLHNKL